MTFHTLENLSALETRCHICDTCRLINISIVAFVVNVMNISLSLFFVSLIIKMIIVVIIIIMEVAA